MTNFSKLLIIIIIICSYKHVGNFIFEQFDCCSVNIEIYYKNVDVRKRSVDWKLVYLVLQDSTLKNSQVNYHAKLSIDSKALVVNVISLAIVSFVRAGWKLASVVELLHS